MCTPDAAELPYLGLPNVYAFATKERIVTRQQGTYR